MLAVWFVNTLHVEDRVIEEPALLCNRNPFLQDGNSGRRILDRPDLTIGEPERANRLVFRCPRSPTAIFFAATTRTYRIEERSAGKQRCLVRSAAYREERSLPFMVITKSQSNGLVVTPWII